MFGISIVRTGAFWNLCTRQKSAKVGHPLVISQWVPVKVAKPGQFGLEIRPTTSGGYMVERQFAPGLFEILAEGSR